VEVSIYSPQWSATIVRRTKHIFEDIRDADKKTPTGGKFL
jgi:hypothetical protein